MAPNPAPMTVLPRAADKTERRRAAMANPRHDVAGAMPRANADTGVRAAACKIPASMAAKCVAQMPQLTDTPAAMTHNGDKRDATSAGRARCKRSIAMRLDRKERAAARATNPQSWSTVIVDKTRNIAPPIRIRTITTCSFLLASQSVAIDSEFD